jgi:hypothetical protein
MKIKINQNIERRRNRKKNKKEEGEDYKNSMY